MTEVTLAAVCMNVAHDKIDVARTETLFFKNLLHDRRPETYGALTST